MSGLYFLHRFAKQESTTPSESSLVVIPVSISLCRVKVSESSYERAQRIAAEVRARRPSMQVKRVTSMDRVVRVVKIKPKKWNEFQHYRDRDPTWIKLHKRLLDDFEFQSMPLASRALAPMLWLLATEHPEAIIDADPEKLAFRLRWPVSEIPDALSPLIGKGFFDVVQFDSASLADGKRVGSPETYKAEDINQRDKPLLSRERDGGRQKRAQVKTEALQYLDFLNAKAGKHFRPVPSTLRVIEARLAEGVSLQDLKTLTVRKCREWLGTDREKFLRPETLCNATKCHSYLGEIAPEVSPCNAPSVIEDSSPTQSPATADGLPPTNLETSPALH
jgi:uncharacterized phage protein (TIGR02220 family)